jgi:hypothetical protein
LGAAIFGRKTPVLAWAGAAGGIIPDLPMYFIVATLRASGYGLNDIFDRLYWSDWWQIANSLGHNIWLWGGMLAGSAVLMRRKGWRQQPVTLTSPPFVFAVSGSALLHSAIDMALHRADAHMHFWPLSDWRFRSPVSYWDPAHYGNWASMLEAVVGILAAVVIFRRYSSRLVRAAIVVAMLLYVAVPAFFILSLGHHDPSLN